MLWILGILLLIALVLVVLSWAPPWSERPTLSAAVFVMILTVALTIFGKT